MCEYSVQYTYPALNRASPLSVRSQVSGWNVRPLELATLRLQNLLGVQLANWAALKPVDDRLLTQLGGCTVVGPGGTPLFNWLDRGLCDVVDFEDVVDSI